MPGASGEMITAQVAPHADVLELRAGIPGWTCLVLGQTLFLELGKARHQECSFGVLYYNTEKNSCDDFNTV